MLCFNANAGNFLDILEQPLPLAGMRSHLPPQTHKVSTNLSDPEDEESFTSTSPQQDSSGEFVCMCVCACVCLCVCIPAEHFADTYNVTGYV